MPPKLLLIMGVCCLVLVNISIVATLYVAGIIGQPSDEELEAQRLAEEALAKEAKYAHLKPLPSFTSRVGYVSSIGEAFDLCEKTLHEKEAARKSWRFNTIESRYLAEKGLYVIFIDYETIVPRGGESKIMKVICEVNETAKKVASWKAMSSK